MTIDATCMRISSFLPKEKVTRKRKFLPNTMVHLKSCVFIAAATCGVVHAAPHSAGEDDELDLPKMSDLLSTQSAQSALNDYINNFMMKQIRENNDLVNNRNFNDMSLLKPTTAAEDPVGPEDSWSVVWYIGCFSALITFFLIVSCSEWCCRKHVRTTTRTPRASPPPRQQPAVLPSTATETPPPAYDLFAPPSYDSITGRRMSSAAEKSEFDVYVVPVHAIGSMLAAEGESAGATTTSLTDDPPSYSAVNMGFREADT